MLAAPFHLGLVPYKPGPATRYMLPVKFVEMIAMGLPAITVANVPICYYFDENMYFAYNPENRTSLTDVVSRIIDHPELLLEKRSYSEEQREIPLDRRGPEVSRGPQATGRSEEVLNTIRFAIVGCGRIAQRHAEHIANAGKLVAACDIVERRAVELAAAHACRPFTSLEKMLAEEPDIEVVSVCTPNSLHASHTILALAAQKHVICEKPMAISARDCVLMIDAAQCADKRLFIVKQNRLRPAHHGPEKGRMTKAV